MRHVALAAVVAVGCGSCEPEQPIDLFPPGDDRPTPVPEPDPTEQPDPEPTTTPQDTGENGQPDAPRFVWVDREGTQVTTGKAAIKADVSGVIWQVDTEIAQPFARAVPELLGFYGDAACSDPFVATARPRVAMTSEPFPVGAMARADDTSLLCATHTDLSGACEAYTGPCVQGLPVTALVRMPMPLPWDFVPPLHLEKR